MINQQFYGFKENAKKCKLKLHNEQAGTFRISFQLSLQSLLRNGTGTPQGFGARVWLTLSRRKRDFRCQQQSNVAERNDKLWEIVLTPAGKGRS
jgi:hypothetical protein